MQITERDGNTTHIKMREVLKSPAGNFSAAAAKVQWMGYGFALVLLLLLALNNWYLTVDDKLLAVENGRIVGTINYNDTQVRSYKEIRSDLKNFLRNFYSVNSITIADDRTVALENMCDDLSTRYLNMWLGNDKKSGKPGSEDAQPLSLIHGIMASDLSYQMAFDFERGKNPIPAVDILDLRGDTFKAIVRGNMLVTDAKGKTTEERVALKVTGDLVDRNQKHSLGLAICSIEYLEETL